MDLEVAGLRFRVDHIAFATPRLERALELLAEQGLGHTAIGECRWPTEDGPERARCVSAMLPDGYLDVIEQVPPPDLDAESLGVVTPSGILLTSDDLEGSRDELVSRGVRCRPAYRIVRRFDGDPAAEQRYRIFALERRHPSGPHLGVIQTEAASSGQAISSSPPRSAIVTRRSLTPFSMDTTATAQAPLPQARVSPVPRSQVR